MNGLLLRSLSMHLQPLSAKGFATLAFLLCLGLTGNFWLTDLSAQDQDAVEGCKLLTPRSYGFDFDPAVPKPSDGEAVSIRTDEGERVVGRLHCRAGDHAVVLMPNGALKDYAWADITLSEKDFKPMRKQDIAKELQKNGFGDFQVSTTRNFVFVYNTSQNFATVTKSILESMKKGVIKQLEKDGFEIENPPVPLVVIMFGTEAQFQAYRQMPKGVVAYYNMVSNHVVLYEPARRQGVRLDVVRGQALSTIAHEGAHQLLHNVGVQKRLSLWPMWLSEGLAEYYAPTSFGNKFRWKGAGVINDLRMSELENYLQARELLGLDGSTIETSVGAAKLNSTGYATAWSIVHYLAEHKPDELVAYIKYVSQLKPFQGMASRSEFVSENVDHFKKFFGDDFETLEQELIEHLKKQEYDSPFSHLPHYVCVVTYMENGQPKRRGCIYHREALVADWKSRLFQSLSKDQVREAKSESRKFSNRSTAAKYLGNFLN